MSYPYRALALCLSVLFTGALANARAESISYPEKNPAFTFDVPSGWKTQFENGALKVAGNADALVLFQHVTDVKEEGAAKESLPRLAEKAAQTFSLKDTAVAVQPMQTEAGKFKTFMTAYKGKDKDNDDAFLYLAIFAPVAGDYYLMTVIYPTKEEAKSADDRAAIQTSLRSVGAAPAEASSPKEKIAPKKAGDDKDADDDDDSGTDDDDSGSE